MNTIKVTQLGKQFKSTWVLEDINLEFESGKIYGIIGRNGTGKTVLLKLIAGLLVPTIGEVEVLGQKLSPQNPIPHSVGVVIEVPGFLPNMSGYKNLKYLAKLKNVIGDAEIYDSMRKLDLDPTSRKRVGNYSLGMRQKLGIAQAIMENPDILLLDEPMNGLDATSVQVVKNLLLKFKNEGKTILLASHHEGDITELCDEVYEMKDGHAT